MQGIPGHVPEPSRDPSASAVRDGSPETPRPMWPCALGLAILALALWLFLVLSVAAHDSWISRGSLRNAAGEWCCGEGDCFVIPVSQVSARADGYRLWVKQIEDGNERVRAEIVPYAEAQPSPDGAYWRCKRSDGSRRCFFAPPPNT
jgi:hypothetical protein